MVKNAKNPARINQNSIRRQIILTNINRCNQSKKSWPQSLNPFNSVHDMRRQLVTISALIGPISPGKLTFWTVFLHFYIANVFSWSNTWRNLIKSSQLIKNEGLITTNWNLIMVGLLTDFAWPSIICDYCWMLLSYRLSLLTTSMG